PVLRTVTNSILRLARRPAIEQFTPFRINITLVGLYMIPGLVHGLGLFFLLNALSPVSGSHYLAITGSYYAASLAGLAAFFAPGGLGVREGVLFLVLPLLVPRESAIVAAIMIRLVTVLAEMALAGVFVGWAWFSHAGARDETGSLPD
ncbi:MAG: flippase-like domain-containing protein, partial [candidate division WOR-3 bacterium]